MKEQELYMYYLVHLVGKNCIFCTHNCCVDGAQFHASKHKDVTKSGNEWPCGYLNRPKESHRTHKVMHL